MKTGSLEPKKPDIVIPEEAADRGPLMSGELCNSDHTYSEVLVQFEKIEPHTRKSRIFLLPTVEQAKRLFQDSLGPFSFEGSVCTHDDIIETYSAQDIWLTPLSEIHHKEATYWSQTSGQIGTLEIKTKYVPGPRLDSRADRPSAWFVARRCFALQILSRVDSEMPAVPVISCVSDANSNLTLSDGAQASFRRYPRYHRIGASGETTRRGYALTVHSYKSSVDVKRDIDAVLVLASFASRERTISAYCSYDSKGERTRYWQLNFKKFRKLSNREDPLIRRNQEDCHNFLQTALDIYFRSKHQALLESAIYALLDNDLTLEASVTRLYSGIQGALVFATQHRMNSKRPKIVALFRSFVKNHDDCFADLWPLFGPEKDCPLSSFRNSIVHGEAFSKSDWLALSYAREHLRWYLERIILISLGWDIESSYVSKGALDNFYAYCNWRGEREKLISIFRNP